MTRQMQRLPAVLLAALLVLLFVFSTLPSLQSSALFGNVKTTTTTTTTTRSTTTKIGKTKYNDLIILEQKDGTFWACNKKTKEKTDYTGVAPTLTNGYWFCRKGKVDTKFTGVAENPFGLWFCKKGKADLDFDGYFVRNSMQIYRINDGAASLYTTDLELKELGIKSGVYKDGSKEANHIMDLTEHLFQENISNAAEMGIVRTRGLNTFKRAILALAAIAFLAFIVLNRRKERKDDDMEL